jgi:very-short-patch-repair endonuclease
MGESLRTGSSLAAAVLQPTKGPNMPTPRRSLDFAIADLAAQHDGLVPITPLIAARYSPDSIQDRVTKHVLATARRGVRMQAGVDLTLRRQAMAALCRVPDGWVSHTTALALRGLAVESQRLHVSAPTQHRLDGVVSHRYPDRVRSTTQFVAGMRMSTVAYALVESASVVDLRTLTVLLDFAIQHRLVKLNRLAHVVTEVGSFRGCRALSELIDERQNGFGYVRSFFEADLDRLLKREGLPLPIRNYRLRTPSGPRILDCAWPWVRKALEADSWQHHSNPSDWARTRTRDRQVTMMGWTVMPVVHADIKRPRELVALLRRLLSDAQSA